MNERNAGFTLVELLVVVVLGAVILGAVYQTLHVQQRAYRQQSAIIQSHESTRAALEVLGSELREISATGADLTMAAPESLTVRALRKMGIVCGGSPSDAVIHVWSLGMPFIGDDRLLVYDEGPTGGTPTWRTARVSSSDSTNYNAASCTDWPEYNLRGQFVKNYRRERVVVGSSLPGSVGYGSPVRSFQALTYGIREVGGQWMLTRRDADGATVPLVGPLAPPGESGLRFTYFDPDGNEISAAQLASNLTRIHSFRITVKGRAPAGPQPVEQELTLSVFLRNNDPTTF